MAQARHMTVLDSFTQTMQEVLHFLGVARGATAATGSATVETGAKERMSKHDPTFAQQADTALGSTLFAIRAFGHPSLLVLAKRLLNSNDGSPETYSDEDLRQLLMKRAKELRKTTPVQLIDLDRYIDEYSRTQLAKAGD
jgi:hypothetical protein